MRYRDFNTMQEWQQLDTADNDGVLLATRQRGFHTLSLYQLEGFYIEVVRHTHFNVVLQVRSFREVEGLEPYLEEIDVSGLIHGQ